ncbi:MAG: response regulator transcription factor [Gracilibacteraceae bacterium]|jgi:DNA-binding response OmpR family regulator|nr:response regulator transcription factor [Gracilibacteraceae bacterium]
MNRDEWGGKLGIPDPSQDPKKPYKILLVEDDAMIASGLVYALEQEGYAVTRGSRVHEARAAIISERFDLSILDMQLPDGTGFDVREALAGTDTAVIFLTVVDDEGSVVRALEGGADDYITKPFRLRELLARVKRTLGTQTGERHNAIVTLGGVSVDTAAGKAYAGETTLDLTALEYRLLLTFAQNKGRTLSRAQILEHIWDAAGNFVEDNTLTVYIKRLREKLGDAANIETVRGVGYRVD